jgi:hypothetical protein
MSDDKRLLIVDDEPNIRLVFQAALTGPDRHNMRRSDERSTFGASSVPLDFGDRRGEAMGVRASPSRSSRSWATRVGS